MCSARSSSPSERWRLSPARAAWCASSAGCAVAVDTIEQGTAGDRGEGQGGRAEGTEAGRCGDRAHVISDDQRYQERHCAHRDQTQDQLECPLHFVRGIARSLRRVVDAHRLILLKLRHSSFIGRLSFRRSVPRRTFSGVLTSRIELLQERAGAVDGAGGPELPGMFLACDIPREME